MKSIIVSLTTLFLVAFRLSLITLYKPVYD